MSITTEQQHTYRRHQVLGRKLVVGPNTALTVLNQDNCNLASVRDLFIYRGIGGCFVIDHIKDGCIVNSIKHFVFDFHNIHGIKLITAKELLTEDVLLIVWGDKSIAIISHDKSNIENISILYQFIGLDDLVLDCLIDCFTLHQMNKFQLIIGYAHNFVDVYEISRDFKKISSNRFQCPQVCVLFSMSFGNIAISNKYKIIIASGTVFGEIILWDIDLENMKHRIIINSKNHEGVIFRMKWSDNNSYLISVSDDRTVRLWEVSTDSNLFTEIFIGWGHSSRLWDADFLQYESEMHIVTCSEDGTVKIWNRFGKSICTLRGHEGSIWRIFVIQDIIISSGNDSSTKLWHVPTRMVLTKDAIDVPTKQLHIPHWNAAVSNLQDSMNEMKINSDGDIDKIVVNKNMTSRRNNGVNNIFVNNIIREIVLVMIDGKVWLIRLAETNDDSESWEELIDFHQNIVSSTIFYHNYLMMYLAVSHPHGTVIVNSFIRNMAKESWKTCKSYNWKAHSLRTVNIWMLKSQSLNYAWLLTSSVKGNCRLWKINFIEDDIIMIPPLIFSCVTGRQEIASCCHLLDSQYTNLSIPSLSLSLQYLLIGDTGGSMSVFMFSNDVAFTNYSSIDFFPISFLLRIHDSDPICDIKSYHQDRYLLSIGPNGYLNFYEFIPIFQENTIKESFESISDLITRIYSSSNSLLNTSIHNVLFPLNPIKFISKMNTLPLKSPESIISFSFNDNQQPSIIVAGYIGSVFIIWDVLQRYEYLHVEGGSWKRPHSFDWNSRNQSCLFSCPIPTKQHDTYVNIFDSRGLHPIDVTLPACLPSNGSGRVFYNGVLIQHRKDEFVAIVGGELGLLYCYSISCSKSGTTYPCQVLEMPSTVVMKNVKACVLENSIECPSSNQGILVAVGGKLSYIIWTWDSSPSIAQFMFYRFDFGTICKNATQDHRLLAVDIICDDLKFTIAFCDSRGFVSLSQLKTKDVFNKTVPLLTTSNSLQTQSYVEPNPSSGNLEILESFVLCEYRYPILTCKLLKVGKLVLGVFGDTLGFVYLYVLKGSLLLNKEVKESNCICKYLAHSMGSNCIDAISISSTQDIYSESSYIIYIVSGGDDQSICIAHIEISLLDDSYQTHVKNLERLNDASGSAINGIRLVLTSQFIFVISIGYDQRLTLWRLQQTVSMDSIVCSTSGEYTCNLVTRLSSLLLKWVTAMITYISDVNAVDVQIQSDNDGILFILIIGEGFEITKLKY